MSFPDRQELPVDTQQQNSEDPPHTPCQPQEKQNSRPLPLPRRPHRKVDGAGSNDVHVSEAAGKTPAAHREKCRGTGIRTMKLE